MFRKTKHNATQRGITRRARIRNRLSTDHDESGGLRTAVLVLVVAAVGLVLFVPTASAQGAACTEILGAQSNDSSGPGGQLADIIGDRSEEIGQAFDAARFEARLANATSDGTRARLIAERTAQIETRLSTVERCWQSHLTARTTGNRTAELDDKQIDSLHRQITFLHQYLNETEDEAVRLPDSLREAYTLDAETFATLQKRVGTLRQAVDRPEVPRPLPNR